MQQSEGVYFDAETYGRIVGAVARRSSNDLERDDETADPTLMNEILQALANDLLELDESSAESLLREFQQGFDKIKNGEQHTCCLAARRVSIDNTTALCPETGVKLQLFTLSQEQKQQLNDNLLQMAAVEHEEFFQKRRKSSKKQHGNGTLALIELARFSDWLRVREGDPFTAIVDGPNVAYFGSGDVQWHQVQLVVNTLEAMGENPLVIMPTKYVAPSFSLSRGSVRELQADEVAVMNELLYSRKKVYVVPPEFFDDYYWMLASVAEQQAGSNIDTLQVPPDDPSGRFPGLRPIVVTNDQMRDHRPELLEERLFRRWTSCHMVAYSIKYDEEKDCKDREVVFFPADFFSSEIQQNLTARFGDKTSAWHIPVSGWPENDRLCLMIKH